MYGNRFLPQTTVLRTPSQVHERYAPNKKQRKLQLFYHKFPAAGNVMLELGDRYIDGIFVVNGCGV